jgi:hypothetical protein
MERRGSVARSTSPVDVIAPIVTAVPVGVHTPPKTALNPGLGHGALRATPVEDSTRERVALVNGCPPSGAYRSRKADSHTPSRYWVSRRRSSRGAGFRLRDPPSRFEISPPIPQPGAIRTIRRGNLSNHLAHAIRFRGTLGDRRQRGRYDVLSDQVHTGPRRRGSSNGRLKRRQQSKDQLWPPGLRAFRIKLQATLMSVRSRPTTRDISRNSRSYDALPRRFHSCSHYSDQGLRSLAFWATVFRPLRRVPRATQPCPGPTAPRDSNSRHLPDQGVEYESRNRPLLS